jgi:hypothetical protein
MASAIAKMLGDYATAICLENISKEHSQRTFQKSFPKNISKLPTTKKKDKIRNI